MNDKVFYVGATSELEAAWRWEQNIKHGTTFISSEEKGWVDDEIEKINAENLAANPESADVIRPLKTFRISITIRECSNMGKHTNPGAAFDDSWNESASAAASRPEPTLQQKVDDSMAGRQEIKDMPKLDGDM